MSELGLVRGWLCPLCKKEFASEACPHSWTDVRKRAEEDRVRAIVQDELERRARRDKT